MHKSKFINLLRTLNKKEIKDFENYLKNLYKRQLTTLKIFSYIKKKHPHYDSLEGERKLIVSKVFGNQGNTAKKLSNSLSDLFALLEEFLLWQKMKSKSYERDFLLLQILKDRKQEDLYFQQLESAKNESQQSPKDNWYYFQQLELHHYQYFDSRQHRWKQSIDSLHRSMESLDLFFLITKLIYACEIYNRSNILDAEEQAPFLIPIPQIDPGNKKSLPILFSLYTLMLELIQKGRLEDYEKIIALLKKNLAVIAKNEKANIIGYLINFAIARVKKGETQFREEIFLLYKIILAEKLFIEDGIISTIGFINVVNVACKLKKFSWLQDFIAEYSSSLAPSTRSDVLKITQAYIAFEEKKFKKVIENLKNVSFGSIDFALRSKSLILRSYYELNGKDTLTQSFAKAFEIYLKRQEAINQNTIKAYLNSVKFVKILLRNKVDKNKLLNDIKQSQSLYFKEWLLEKVQAIKS